MSQSRRDFGKYQLEYALGAGAMGSVYQARHAVLGRLVAIKVVRSPSPQGRERVLREARVQAGLSHPNVIAVHDVVEELDEVAIVMDLVNGPDLRRWFETQPSRAARLALFRQVVAGVGAAHAAGLVHRDLKPENVLVDTQQGNLVARVTDFGLVSTDNLTLPRLTHSGVVLGTPAYMAPEQMRDAAAVDARADIFSLGCILYEVLCRRLAFPQGDFVRLVQAIEREEYLDPGILVPGLAPGLIRLVRDCLRADPELRPSSCVELAARLDEAVAAGPARGIPNTAADQVEAVHDDLSISSLPSAAIQYTPTRLEGGAPRQHTASLPAISLDGTETQTAARRRRIKVLGVAGVVCALVLVTGAWWLARTGVAASEVPPETGIEAELPGSMATGDEAAKVTRVPQPEGSSSPPVTSTGDENVIRASTAANQPVSILPTVGPQATAPSREAPPSTAPPTATEPASPTAAEPASRTQATGRVRFSGDATDVWLESGGRRYRGGAVPEGTYAAWASFGEAPAFNAGLITIVAGNSVVVKCAGAFQTCAVSE